MTTTHLRITDGTTTINFSSGDDMKLIYYNPEIADMDNLEASVKESFDVDFIGSTSKNRQNYNNINRLFVQAQNFSKNGNGAEVWVEIDPGSSGEYWRSKLLKGRILLDKNTFGWQWDTRFRLRIEWERESGVWDGPLTQLRLTNASDTNVLTAIAVNNCTDATNSLENFVDINGEDIEGDLPASVKIEMKNSYASAEPADEIYIFQNVYSNPSSLTHILEGEDATGAGVTPTAESGDGASENNYATIAWTATTETKIATWAISSAQLSYMADGRFSILARWYGAFPYTNCYLRFTLEDSANILWSGNLVLVSNTRELHSLETLRLGSATLSSLAAVNLCLYGLRAQAGTHTINLDYLQLSPIASNDGWKRFKSKSAGVDYLEYFYHDKTEQKNGKECAYIVDGSSNKRFEFAEYGGEILLVPNTDQRLYFLSCDSTNGEALVEQTWDVRLWYRPRRISI